MTPLLLALASAGAFGGMSVAIRFGLRHGGGARSTSAATLVTALLVAAVAAVPRHDATDAWKFFLAGILAPGLSQLLFTLSIREVGASRTSVTVGSAPLFALAIAFVFLGEPVRAPLVVGAVAIVAGGIALAAERNRPEHLRARGLAYAVAAAILFAVRDNIVRALHAHGSPETVAVSTMLAGLIVAILVARGLPRPREIRALAPAGLLFGASYVCLFEAYFRGRVSVVSPLVATESLWGVGLAVLLFGHAEGVGRRLVLGALAIVAGGILIGVSTI